jgi:C1A family cysteine protease
MAKKQTAKKRTSNKRAARKDRAVKNTLRPQKKKASAAKKPKTMSRILNCVPSQDVENDWGIANARDAGMLAAAAIPAQKDLRASWWTIGDQGETGSCVGWATADSVLRWHFVESGKITKTDRLAVRFIWMSAKETDVFDQRPTTFIESDGTSLKAALDIARKFGCVHDRLLPFATGKLYPGASKTFYAIAAQLKISAYINVGMDPSDWREWIANNGPILTRLNVDKSWNNATENDGDLDAYIPYPPGDLRGGGHAVALVGYTEDRFIVRNSWGKTWGDEGFAYAAVAYAEEAFTEAYGVTV